MSRRIDLGQERRAGLKAARGVNQRMRWVVGIFDRQGFRYYPDGQAEAVVHSREHHGRWPKKRELDRGDWVSIAHEADHVAAEMRTMAHRARLIVDQLDADAAKAHETVQEATH